ncbi:MAG: hypothetical protein JJE04_18435 [Acidobacteriia bacterium]|nr:hypothetical protein [Terriglobia bacterium]
MPASHENSLLVRLRPDGPWRLGPTSGARDRVDSICHSDTLYSALCWAMLSLGLLEEWLDATARDTGPEGPAVRFSSMLPWQGDLLYVAGPRHLWPPPSSRLRTRGAQFIPTSLLPGLLAAAAPDGGLPALEEDKWEVDGVSRCLIRSGRKGAFAGPFRHSLRSNAAVDRIANGRVAVHQTACLEFSPNAGLWCVAQFRSPSDEQRWTAPLQAGFRLLADSGIGGERSRGWGHAEVEEFRPVDLSKLVFGGGQAPESPAPNAYWLLSLFSPGPGESIDWEKGNYSLLTRSGRVESPIAWGAPKKSLRMVSEGSVLVAPRKPVGCAHNVAPDGFPHPVFRSGFAVSVPVPWRAA